MASLDPIPQARVVRKAGQLMAPPRAPRSDLPHPMLEHARTALSVVMGLWPLTGVVLLMIGLVIMAANNGVR
jgi:hypothetical protein